MEPRTRSAQHDAADVAGRRVVSSIALPANQSSCWMRSPRATPLHQERAPRSWRSSGGRRVRPPGRPCEPSGSPGRASAEAGARGQTDTRESVDATGTSCGLPAEGKRSDARRMFHVKRAGRSAGLQSSRGTASADSGAATVPSCRSGVAGPARDEPRPFGVPPSGRAGRTSRSRRP